MNNANKPGLPRSRNASSNLILLIHLHEPIVVAQEPTIQYNPAQSRLIRILQSPPPPGHRNQRTFKTGAMLTNQRQIRQFDRIYCCQAQVCIKECIVANIRIPDNG